MKTLLKLVIVIVCVLVSFRFGYLKGVKDGSETTLAGAKQGIDKAFDETIKPLIEAQTAAPVTNAAPRNRVERLNDASAEIAVMLVDLRSLRDGQSTGEDAFKEATSRFHRAALDLSAFAREFDGPVTKRK